MQTIKLPYSTNDIYLIHQIQVAQNRLIGKCYQFLKSEPTQKETTHYLNQQETELDSWFKQSTVYESRGMFAAVS